jgi:hypothetical protein
MPLQEHATPQHELSTEAARLQAGQMLAPQALEAVGLAAASFYGAQEHYLGEALNGGFQSMIVMPEEEGANHRDIGVGRTPAAALHDAYRAMCSQEAAHTRPLVRIEMTDDTAVSFTELEHYNPKIAPDIEAHKVPGYLKDIIAGTEAGSDTYQRTIEGRDWQKKLFGFVGSYLADSERGKALQGELKINSLQALTPEQAVKLSVAVVQDLSKYSLNSAGEADGKSADAMTTEELLRAGQEHKDDPNWEGNGICRNVASNVKAVFEALKQSQGELSMLHNTYAAFNGSMRGEGYTNTRPDFMTEADGSGHAWNTFVTVDGKGSASITVVDATWALDKDPADAISHMDYTLLRMASAAREVFAASDHKKEAFTWLTDYYNQLTSPHQGLTPEKARQMREYTMTEYLKVAAIALPEYSDGETMPLVPDGVTEAAYNLQDRLEVPELQTLFKLSEAKLITNFPAILKQYVDGETMPRPEWQRIGRLVQPDDRLQAEIYEILGPDKMSAYADKEGGFRARLRELRPDQLPAFDLATPTDAKEFLFLAESQGLNQRDPKAVVREAHRRLEAAANNNPALVEAVTFQRTDYDLVKNLVGLTTRIAKIQA